MKVNADSVRRPFYCGHDVFREINELFWIENLFRDVQMGLCCYERIDNHIFDCFRCNQSIVMNIEITHQKEDSTCLVIVDTSV